MLEDNCKFERIKHINAIYLPYYWAGVMYGNFVESVEFKRIFPADDFIHVFSRYCFKTLPLREHERRSAKYHSISYIYVLRDFNEACSIFLKHDVDF